MRRVAREIATREASRNTQARMMAAAVPPGEQTIVVAYSGHIDEAGPHSAISPYPKLLDEYRAKLPWRDLPPTNGRIYSDCAEAHVWLDLCSRGRDPRNYFLVSFNNLGQVASPCENCARWVRDAFSFVYSESRSYEGHPRQRPDYRQHN